MNRALFFLAALALSWGGCYYDIEEELYPSVECQTDNLSFQSDIAPIIQRNCLGCHSQAANQGNVVLEGYNRLKTYVDNGKLQGVINHRAGFSPMPKNQPKLLECEIAKIEQWIADGALDN
jgi:hypothetical protein